MGAAAEDTPLADQPRVVGSEDRIRQSADHTRSDESVETVRRFAAVRPGAGRLPLRGVG